MPRQMPLNIEFPDLAKVEATKGIGLQNVLRQQGIRQGNVQHEMEKLKTLGALVRGVTDDKSWKQAINMYIKTYPDEIGDLKQIPPNYDPKFVGMLQKITGAASEKIGKLYPTVEGWQPAESAIGKKQPTTEKGGKTIELEDPKTGKPAIFELISKDGRLQIGKKLGFKYEKPELPETTDPNEIVKRGNNLRDDFTKESKTFINVRDAQARVLASAEEPSAAGDLALIFNYMKILDPESVVREGEFATAETAGSVPQRIWAKYNKVLEGERLSPEMRKDFVNRAKKLFEKQLESHKQLRSEYSRIAKRQKVDPEDVIVNYIVSFEDLKTEMPKTLTPAHTAPEIESLYKRYGLNPEDK